MNKVKLVGLAMALPILALSGPAFAQSVPKSSSHIVIPALLPGQTMSGEFGTCIPR